jgi:hypothetical protein
MNIINCVAKWPGSVHDARILRESPLFDAFESVRKPVNGIVLGDSGYMLRDWLMTPIINPRGPKEEAYNTALCGTRCTVERCIGILKRRWHCLHAELRVAPAKACKIVCACVALHNRAMQLHHDLGDDLDDDDDDDDDVSSNGDDDPAPAGPQANITVSERARIASGKAARERLVQNYF